MVKRVSFLIAGALVWSTSLFGQSLPGTFGAVPDSLFSDNRSPSHAEVPFVYTLKRMNVTFEETDRSIVAVLNYHVRVKIYDASVKEAAVVGIPYYYGNNIEQVSNIRGITHLGAGQQVPLDTAKVRTVNLNSRYNVKEFTMPAVRDGSVIEYAYTVRRRYIEELPDFYLSHPVPTRRAEVTITYPKYLRYRASVQNYAGALEHNITPVDTSSEVPKIYTFPQPEPMIRETWRATDIPAVQNEAYISSLDDYRGKIKFQLSEFGLPRQTLENSWDFVVAEIRRKQQVNARIDANERARALGRSIGAALGDEEAVQDSIFSYLNRTAQYSGSKAPFSPAGDAAVLEGEPSDQAAINQTLAAMLRGAGIEAHPVLTSTRKSGRINRSFPSFLQFNGQLVHTRIDGTSYFMDASFSYSHPNLVPVDVYNQTGLLLKSDSYRWVDVQPGASSFTIRVDVDARLDREGNLSGTFQAVNGGYPARQIRKLQAEKVPVPDIIRRTLLDGYPEAHLAGARLAETGDNGVALTADFSLPNYGVSFADGIEFPPMVVGYLMQNPFGEGAGERDLPVTLDAPERLDLSYSIQLPAGMRPAGDPEDRIIRLPGALFEEQYDMEANTLNYRFRIDISRQQFSADLYPRLRALYNRWVELSNSRWRLVQ